MEPPSWYDDHLGTTRTALSGLAFQIQRERDKRRIKNNMADAWSLSSQQSLERYRLEPLREAQMQQRELSVLYAHLQPLAEKIVREVEAERKDDASDTEESMSSQGGKEENDS